MSDFIKELTALINKHSFENGSNTPDFMLAEYLCDCLDAYEKVVTERDRWSKVQFIQEVNDLTMMTKE